MITLGIDLGTSNTVLAVDGAPLPLTDQANEQPTTVMPSVVAFPPNGHLMIGRPAKARRPIDAKNTIYSAKRIIGRPWHAYEVATFREHYPFDLIKGPDDMPRFKTRAGHFSAADIAELLLRGALLSEDIELGSTAAVVTVPAEFREDQRAAILGVAEGLGFSTVACLDEPVAAAMAQLEDAVGSRMAVYDLGGGTFDFAVVDCTTVPFQVLHHSGEAYLGGDDIDLGMAKWAASQILQRHRWDPASSPEVFNQLVYLCEEAKVTLTERDEAAIDLSALHGPIGEDFLYIDQDRLWELSQWVVHQTFHVCDHVLAEMRSQGQGLDGVITVGGGSALRPLRAAIAEYFGSEPLFSERPLEAVAIGASLHFPE